MFSKRLWMSSSVVRLLVQSGEALITEIQTDEAEECVIMITTNINCSPSVGWNSEYWNNCNNSLQKPYELGTVIITLHIDEKTVAHRV